MTLAEDKLVPPNLRKQLVFHEVPFAFEKCFGPLNLPSSLLPPIAPLDLLLAKAPFHFFQANAQIDIFLDSVTSGPARR